MSKYNFIFIRIAKTALWAFLSTVFVVKAGGLSFDLSDATIGLAIISTLVAVQNLYISPTSSLGRGLSTFYQVGIGAWATMGFDFSYAAITASLAAGLSASFNFIKETI